MNPGRMARALSKHEFLVYLVGKGGCRKRKRSCCLSKLQPRHKVSLTGVGEAVALLVVRRVAGGLCAIAWAVVSLLGLPDSLGLLSCEARPRDVPSAGEEGLVVPGGSFVE